MTDEKLATLIGPVAMMDFEKATEAERRKIRAWVPTLATLTDTAFIDLCTDVVSAGAIAESRRSQEQEPYIRGSACVKEAERRHLAAGHKPECRGDNLYMQGYRRAKGLFGLDPGEPDPCTCGLGA